MVLTIILAILCGLLLALCLVLLIQKRRQDRAVRDLTLYLTKVQDDTSLPELHTIP